LERKSRFDLRECSSTVMENESVAIGGENEGDVQDFGVVESLLHTVTNRVEVILRFNDGDRDIRLVIEDVVGKLRFPTGHHLPANVDLPLGEMDFSAELSVIVPA